MANPFEDPDASYRVLVNHEGQHSLWPASQPVPGGWSVAHDTDSRASCLEYIEENWTDMRPKSLIEAQGGLPAWVRASCERKEGTQANTFVVSR